MDVSVRIQSSISIKLIIFHLILDYWSFLPSFSSFLQERFYFDDNVLPSFQSGIPLLKSRLQQLPNSENISIVF
ncbi:unnamed protein product [Lactuca virosa]|uniref:Uncharacterized protein n=1 Tax=Lactuca virosa TaxID=75947 RepID=A0AAU9PPW9_9ASTR|nr:unnamed protein product [Lactuca virosa]